MRSAHHDALGFDNLLHRTNGVATYRAGCECNMQVMPLTGSTAMFWPAQAGR
jgi:hypothetical protein